MGSSWSPVSSPSVLATLRSFSPASRSPLANADSGSPLSALWFFPASFSSARSASPAFSAFGAIATVSADAADSDSALSTGSFPDIFDSFFNSAGDLSGPDEDSKEFAIEAGDNVPGGMLPSVAPAAPVSASDMISKSYRTEIGFRMGRFQNWLCEVGTIKPFPFSRSSTHSKK